MENTPGDNQGNGGGGRRIVFFGAGPLPEKSSVGAPGVANRLRQFLLPALAAGHECLVCSIENDAPPLTEKPPVATRTNAGWTTLRVRLEDCKAPGRLAQWLAKQRPDLMVGAGTLLAGWTACAVTRELAELRDVPVWADLFGDPLAEIQAKAEVLGNAFSADEHILVWRMMLEVLARADAFSTVSRRQAEALLGQLALAGRLGGVLFAAPHGNPGCADIHPIPCALESFDQIPLLPSEDRIDWRRHHGLPEDSPVALWSGGFNAWADPVTLVRGIETAMDHDPALHLVATGGALPGYLARVDEEFRALAGASRHSGRIHALGWLPLQEAQGWIRAADVALLADRPCAETRLGARNRLLYHAAARCPIIASRGTEVVADMEAADALLAFPSGDGAALAEAIVRVLNNEDLGRDLGRRGFEFCRRNYSFDATAAPFLVFAADPARIGNLEKPGGAAWIADFLDVSAREAERLELQHYRGGRLARLKAFFTR